MNLSIGIGITAENLPGRTSLFQVSEGVITLFKFIIFTNQVHHWGLQVDKALQKYDGKSYFTSR